ncbi:hypothetical protein Tco_0225113, partial [Tanacetum coccineum]
MEHRGIFDSGCSGHMTGNRPHLEDYQALSKVGSVTFGGSKGSISGKDTIRLGNLASPLHHSNGCIMKNPVYHSKTKHIEIRHHFIRDCYEKKLISVEKIHTNLNVADLLTKPFDGPWFNYLVVSI